MENKSIEIFKKLDEAYPKEIKFIKRDDPFRFLCAVILSASSTDREAVRAEERLNSVFDTAKKIAEADIAQIENLIKNVWSDSAMTSRSSRRCSITRYLRFCSEMRLEFFTLCKTSSLFFCSFAPFGWILPSHPLGGPTPSARKKIPNAVLLCVLELLPLQYAYPRLFNVRPSFI